jgi:hypothetical protein
MIKKTNKTIDKIAAINDKGEEKSADLGDLPTISLSLRFLRKKNGSTMLQEGVNEVWTDVPMVVEQ